MSPQADLAEVAQSICLSEGLNFRQYVGGGTFKKVFRVEREENEVYALKVVTEASHRTAREIEALQRCDHPNIARLFDVGSHDYQGHSYDYLLEEFLAGGTLTQHLEQHRTYSNDQILSLGEKMINAISHVAELGLVHRDIKPDNIMFREDGSTPVLVDFGLVRDLTATSLTQTWAPRGPGTPYYASPEQLNNKKRLIDWRTDQFSLGVVLCIARFVVHIFKHRNEPDFSRFTVERVARHGSRNQEILNQIHSAGLDCLERMTRVWPVQRYRFPEILSQEWNRQG
jgi:serine/threonine protein kinase